MNIYIAKQNVNIVDAREVEYDRGSVDSIGSVRSMVEKRQWSRRHIAVPFALATAMNATFLLFPLCVGHLPGYHGAACRLLASWGIVRNVTDVYSNESRYLLENDDGAFFLYGVSKEFIMILASSEFLLIFSFAIPGLSRLLQAAYMLLMITVVALLEVYAKKHTIGAYYVTVFPGWLMVILLTLLYLVHTLWLERKWRRTRRCKEREQPLISSCMIDADPTQVYREMAVRLFVSKSSSASQHGEGMQNVVGTEDDQRVAALQEDESASAPSSQKDGVRRYCCGFRSSIFGDLHLTRSLSCSTSPASHSSY